MVDGCAQNKNCAKCVFWLPLLVSIEWGLYLFRTYSFHVVSFTPPVLMSICTRESCASLYNVIHLAQKRSNDNRFTDKMRTFHTDASFHCLVHFHSIYTMERKKKWATITTKKQQYKCETGVDCVRMEWMRHCWGHRCVYLSLCIWLLDGVAVALALSAWLRAILCSKKRRVQNCSTFTREST